MELCCFLVGSLKFIDLLLFLGKTAAFMLPVLERLLYKPKQTAVTRVLVLSPTRELAVQIYTVAKQLAQFTNIEISLSAGKLPFLNSLFSF